MRLPIYLDYMATTPVDPRVAAKMQQYLTMDGVFGNPASTHQYGLAAQDAVGNARKQVAALINADPKEIIWTSGATEAINLALKGAANFYKRQGKHIITVKTEHKAVLDVCKYLEGQGFAVTYLKPKPDGLLDLNKLVAAIRQDTILVSVMHVNNEIGVIQDIAAIGDITRERGILLHVDAAQSVGKIPLDLKQLKVDLLSFTAHKIYGPKGIGALYIRHNPPLYLEPQIHGGGQEYGFRSGTLPTQQIVGMGEALAIAGRELEQDYAHILKLRNHFLQSLQGLVNIHVNGSLTSRIPGNLNLSFAGIDAEVLIAGLQDLAVSTGSACSTLSLEPSYVLRAIDLNPDLIRSAIRFSFGRFTTLEEVAYAAASVKASVKLICHST